MIYSNCVSAQVQIGGGVPRRISRQSIRPIAGGGKGGHSPYSLNMAVDIRFIADKAGVSPSTVSRVLNGSKAVSPSLQKRVMEQVDKYNYRPNLLARGLIINKSNLIGVVMPSVSGSFHSKMVTSIEETAAQHNYNVIISNVRANFEREKESFEVFRERRVDGIILLHENTIEELKILEGIAKLPMVLASINIPGSRLSVVGVDDEKAAYDIVAYLLRIGHRRIGAIFNDCYSLGVLRKRGFQKAVAEYGVACNPLWIREGRCDFSAGESLCAQIFSGPDTPTALFCVSDEQAIGAVNYLLDHGYRVPEDVSVAGFDDIPLSSLLRPKLTTVRQPIEDIGREAVYMLLRMMETKQVEQAVLPHQVIVRQTTCAREAALH